MLVNLNGSKITYVVLYSRISARWEGPVSAPCAELHRHPVAFDTSNTPKNPQQPRA
jgi:hypothetical protein